MSEYDWIQLRNGTWTLHNRSVGECFHPGVGPVQEASELYVRQLDLPRRLAGISNRPGVIWDVGLGAAANLLTLLKFTQALETPLIVHSFDHSLEPLAMALKSPGYAPWIEGYETAVDQLLHSGSVDFSNQRQPVQWRLHHGDFPDWLRDCSEPPVPAPDAVLYDAFSPAKNPEMWTLGHFSNLYARLDPSRPCSLATYSRSTRLRVTLLLAGFFAGTGSAVGMKEETTLAANDRHLIGLPLDGRWLERVQRSANAEPLRSADEPGRPIQADSLAILRQHPQFRTSELPAN